MELRYVYVGAEGHASELAAWLAAVGADGPRWRFQAFGADVAGGGPRVRTGGAGRRPPAVGLGAADLRGGRPRMRAQAAMEAGGWRVAGPAAGTPEGPTLLLRSPSGIEIALLRVDRPTVMEGAYADPGNERRVMPDLTARPSTWAASL